MASESHDDKRSEEELDDEMRQIEKDPPEKLEDWPKGQAMYKTFGGPEGDHSYEEGPERQLGPSGLRHNEDGSVSIDGEKVEDADEFKRESVEDPLK